MIAGRKNDVGQKFANSEDLIIGKVAWSGRCVTGTEQIFGDFTNTTSWIGTSQ